MALEDQEYCRLTIVAELDDGTRVMNRETFKADLETTQTNSAVLSVMELHVEGLYGYLAGQIDQNVTMEECNVNKIAWNESEQYWEVTNNIGVFTPTVAFTNIAEPLPNQVAMWVTGKTARPKTKGRIYCFPWGEDQQDHGIIGAGAITAMVNFAAEYIDDLVFAAGNTLVSGVVRETTSGWLPFVATLVGDVLGTQRRRRFTVGV